jgi:hypothetical protein
MRRDKETYETAPTREISTAAYYEIRNRGLLRHHKRAAFEAVFEYGPGTASEIYHKSGFQVRLGVAKNDFSNRLKELRLLGVLIMTGVRKCTITGQSVTVWAVSGKLPVSKREAELGSDKIKKTLPRSILPKVLSLIDSQKNWVSQHETLLRRQLADLWSGSRSDLSEATIQQELASLELMTRELNEMRPYFKS